MKNLSSLMKQAKEMQGKMAEMQAKMEEMEVSGEAGGGMVQAVLNGKGQMRGLTIDPALVDPNEKEVLEDLIIAAVNDAKGKIEATMSEEMQKMTGGLPLPAGFKMPF